MMDVLIEEIQNEVANGGWISVPVEDGHYEGSLQTLDVDSLEIEVCNLDEGELEVVATGTGDVVYKDHNSQEQVEQDVEVAVKARISISAGNHNPAKHSVSVTMDTTILGASRRS